MSCSTYAELDAPSLAEKTLYLSATFSPDPVLERLTARILHPVCACLAKSFSKSLLK